MNFNQYTPPNQEETNKRKRTTSSIRKPQKDADTKRQKQIKHYNVVISCHGGVVEAQPGLKRKQKYNIHKELTDLNFLVSYGETLVNNPWDQNITTLYQCGSNGKCNYSSSASIVMRLVCDSKASNIIKKIPTNTGEITLSEMAFSFDTESQVPYAKFWYQELFGFWICADDLEPTRLLTYKNFDSTISYNWQDMFNHIGITFNNATSSGIIPSNNEITISLFMFVCRANANPTSTHIQFAPTSNIKVDMRGGDDSQPVVNKIDKLTNDIKEQELNELNKTGFVQLTEEQFDLFLSPKNPTLGEVINSLDNTEVQKLTESKTIGESSEKKQGGKPEEKKGKNNKQKTKRKQKRRKTRGKKNKSIRRKK